MIEAASVHEALVRLREVVGAGAAVCFLALVPGCGHPDSYETFLRDAVKLHQPREVPKMSYQDVFRT